MSKTIIVAGYGPGISHAVAEKFGAAGHSVALVARNASKLAEGVKALESKRITAAAFPTDLSDPAKVQAMVRAARAKLGPIAVLHWNAAALVAGDLLTAPLEEVRTLFELNIVGLLAGIRESLSDLKASKTSSVLVTNGGFGLSADGVDGYAVKTNNMGLGVANAAKHKVMRLLTKRLATEGVFAGELMVLSTVKGTPWDRGDSKLTAAEVAEKFWQMHQEHKESLLQIG